MSDREGRKEVIGNLLATVEVPGTLSNLGAGYDALGLAVDVTNAFSIVEGPAAPGDSDLVIATATAAAARFGGSVPAFHVVQEERVPRSRGLGSSATARVAGLLAWSTLAGRSLAEIDEDELLAFLAEAEGHPDNAWPALLGGLVICAGMAKRLTVHPDWRVAAIHPAVEVSTPRARAALPATVAHADAVANVRGTALLVAGLVDGDLEAVQRGVADRLHQAWRAPLISADGDVGRAFEAARGLGGAPFISGSGSTLAAFVHRTGAAPEAVAEALAGPFRARGVGVAVRTYRPRAVGAVVA
jgi:homoserine kinase